MFNKIFLFLIVFSLSFGFRGQAQTAEHKDIHDVTQATIKEVKNAGNKSCPVSGEKVGQDGMEPVSYEYEGKIYNFCCVSCIDEFKKGPKKYIKIVEEEIKNSESHAGKHH